MKKFTKYFGGIYMKYWYIAFAVIVVLMLLFKLNDSAISEYKVTIYNRDGSVASEKIIKQEELPKTIKTDEPKTIEPVKMFF